MNSIGYLGEAAATAYLISNNFTILERNFKTKMSEIDIIAAKNSVVHFIEVKANKHSVSASEFKPEYRVNPNKVRKILLSAYSYWNRKYANRYNNGWQVDIIGVTIDTTSGKAKIRYWPNITSDLI